MHFAATVSSSGEVLLYVDGIPSGGATTAPAVLDDPLLDDVRIYSRALTASEIAALAH